MWRHITVSRSWHRKKFRGKADNNKKLIWSHWFGHLNYSLFVAKNANDKFKKSWRNKHQLISSSCSNKFSQEKRKTIPPNFITESSKRLWRIKRYLQKFVGSANQKDLIMYRETSFSNLRKKTFSEGNSNLPDLELDLDCTDNNCLHVVRVTQLWSEYRAPKAQIHPITGHLSIYYSVLRSSNVK